MFIQSKCIHVQVSPLSPCLRKLADRCRPNRPQAYTLGRPDVVNILMLDFKFKFEFKFHCKPNHPQAYTLGHPDACRQHLGIKIS